VHAGGNVRATTEEGKLSRGGRERKIEREGGWEEEGAQGMEWKGKEKTRTPFKGDSQPIQPNGGK